MKKMVVLLILFLIPMKTMALETSATASILMDTDNNRILYANNIHKVRSIASISKIMTAIVAIESGKLDETVTVGDEIKKAYGSGIYIQIGENIKLLDLLYGLMLRSGNDAALTIASYVGGNVDEFVKKMNEKAQEIGMKNTVFNNPSGLDQEKGNYSTAYDMAILTSYAMKNETYRKIVSTKSYKVKTNMNFYSWINKNKLLHTYKYSTCALGENTCQSRTWNCSDCYYGENTCQSKYVCTKYSCPSGYSASGSSCTKTTTVAVGSYSSANECSALCSREYGTGSYCSGSTCYNKSTQTASKVCSAGYTDDCYSGHNTCEYGCDYDPCYTGHNTCKVGWTL